MKFVLYETTDRVARVTLNRPEKRNALNHQAVDELTLALVRAGDDANVKVVQLHASGDVFSAGADLEYLQQLQTNTYNQNLEDSKHLAALFKTIHTLPKPVIARVQGAAVAGGCGLATVCDFSVASANAKFGYTESRIGFVPAIVMLFLVRKIGDTRARDLMLTGRLIDADEAAAIGLITCSVPHEELDQTVNRLTNVLLDDTSAQSLDLIKQMLGSVHTMPLDEALQYAAETNAKARATDDCRKGIAAFLNKEKIRW